MEESDETFLVNDFVRLPRGRRLWRNRTAEHARARDLRIEGLWGIHLGRTDPDVADVRAVLISPAGS